MFGWKRKYHVRREDIYKRCCDARMDEFHYYEEAREALEAGRYSEAATASHRAHQFSLVKKALQGVLGDG